MAKTEAPSLPSAGELIDLLGGTKTVSLRLNIHPTSVSHWKTTGIIPEGHLVKLAATIERRSGGSVTRRDLFPREWARIWPELAVKAQRPAT